MKLFKKNRQIMTFKPLIINYLLLLTVARYQIFWVTIFIMKWY